MKNIDAFDVKFTLLKYKINLNFLPGQLMALEQSIDSKKSDLFDIIVLLLINTFHLKKKSSFV